MTLAPRSLSALLRRNTTSLWLVGILFIAALVRLWGISVESLWLDEATSLMLARMSVGDLIQWTALDIHPPLYYTLLHFWIALGDTELAVRSLSALAGALNVLVIYGLGKVWFNRRTGQLAAGLLALLPVHVWYSQEARMYAWVTLFISCSIWLAFLVWQKPSRTLWIAYVLVTAASLYTHYYAIFGIMLQNVFFLYLLLRHRIDRRHVLRWLGAELLVLLLFLPWLPTFMLPITVGGGGWIAMGVGRPGPAALAQTAVLYMVGTGRASYPELLRRGAYLLYTGLLIMAIWPHSRRLAESETGRALWSEREATGFAVAYLVVPPGMAWLASQVFKPMYSARYMLPFAIPFVLLLAVGLDRLRWRWVRASLLLALVAVMGFGLVAQVRLLEKPDWRGLTQRLEQEANPGDLVLFMPGWHAKPFDYYAQGRLDLYSDVPIPVDQYGDEALARVAEAIEGHPRIWFIWETGHYTDSTGQVYQYLLSRCDLVDSWPLPEVGQIILFENPG